MKKLRMLITALFNCQLLPVERKTRNRATPLVVAVKDGDWGGQEGEAKVVS